MKKIYLTLLGLLACIEVFAQLGYRCEGDYIELTPDTVNSQFYVHPRNIGSKQYLEKIANLENPQNNHKVYMISENAFFVSSKSNLQENDYLSELFYDSKHNPYYVLPRIILALKDNANIGDILKRYTGILILDSPQRLKGMMTLSCNLSSAQDVLKVVAELNTCDEVKWCEPDMICKWETYDSNPLFPMQYYLKNYNSGQYDINVIPAWNITRGNENITVAVIDTGVDPEHEDLSGNVLQGYTVGDATGYGKPKNANAINRKGHGVACAGIIGAKDNGIGILGVANGVKILPVNIVPYLPYKYSENGITYKYDGFTTSDSDLAEAIQWAAERADVLNCSWGSGSAANVVITAINNAMVNGRNGKGCVVVAAAGNNPDSTLLAFPARMNGVIAVGAVDEFGNIQDYSQTSSDLDLVAFSGDGLFSSNIVTTDRMDTLGYNPNSIPYLTLLPGLPPIPLWTDLPNMNYTKYFSGTSAACPQVSGVAALILSLRPDLTQSEVRSLLCSTAHDLGLTGKDDTFGYGLVDAYAALTPINYYISGDTVFCDTATYVINGLPSSYTINWSVDNSNFSITPSGNQCIVTYIGPHEYDYANLSASIYYNSILIKQFTKSIVAGAPPLNAGILITGGDGSHVHWTSNLAGNTVDINEFYPIYYTQFEANLYRISPVTFEPEATPIRHWYSNSWHMVFDCIPQGWYLLQVRGINNCGVSEWLEDEIECVDTEWLRSNGNETELTIMYSRQGQMLTVSVNQAPRSTTDNAYTIQLWNELNMVRELKPNDPVVQIPMTGLKNGLYTVRYVNRDEVIAKKFMKF